jgi:hypothetical protein
MGRRGHEGYKRLHATPCDSMRLSPPMVVQRAAVAPPGCVSVGGAIPVHHQYHPPRPAVCGHVSSRMHTGVVLV